MAIIFGYNEYKLILIKRYIGHIPLNIKRTIKHIKQYIENKGNWKKLDVQGGKSGMYDDHM